MSAQLQKRILVVDDDPVVGKSFNRVLSQEGYVVVTAHNGQDALAKLEDGDYDVVFTDIRMPGMDGLELAEQVHVRKAWTPVVIVTGYGTQANEARARAAGVSAFLQKPLSPEQIGATARQAMARPAAVSAPAAITHDIARTIEALRAEVGTPQTGGLKQMALLLAAPFIGLAFFVLAPLAGMATLAGLGIKALADQLMTAQAQQDFGAIAKMLAAPVLGLLFFVLAPLAGIALLGGLALKAAAKGLLQKRTLTFLKNAGLFFAAPFIGLAYILAMPLVGLGTLAWLGLRQRQHPVTAK